MMTCEKCSSNENPDDANFCGQCGAAFEVDARVTAAVKQSLQELKAERKWASSHTGMGGRFYVEDVNSRRIFGRLRRECGLRAIPHLVEFLKDADFLMRWKAIRLLAHYGYADGDVLRDFWQKEKEGLARILILESIENAGDASACELLVDISANDDDREIRAKAVPILGKFAKRGFRAQAIAALLDASYDNDSWIRRPAIELLVNLRATEVVASARDLIAEGGFSHDGFNVVAQAIMEMGGDVECLATVFRRVPESVGGVVGPWFDTFLHKVVPVCVRRFGRERVLAEATGIAHETARKKIEEAARSTPAS